MASFSTLSRVDVIEALSRALTIIERLGFSTLSRVDVIEARRACVLWRVAHEFQYPQSGRCD